MSDGTYTSKDMAAIERTQFFKSTEANRKSTLRRADDLRNQIEKQFPAAEGWYWCQGVDGELYLKEQA